MCAELISAVANSAIAIIALLALLIAWRQLHRNHEDQKNATAKAIFKDYLRLAFDSPLFSSPSKPISAPKFNLITDKPTEYERYEWYVAFLLYSAEEILNLKTGKDWRDTLFTHIQYHALYCMSDDYNPQDYSSEVQTLVAEVTADYKKQVEEMTVKQPNLIQDR